MVQLNHVEKPVRYIGSEWNSVTEKPEAKLRVAIAYPDVYEVGMSYLGLQILYGLMNEQPWIWCERAFAPWPDLEKLLRDEGRLLATLESETPYCQLDILGFSLQHEMLYTNTLAMLELGGIPIEAVDRTDEHPIILGGGPSSFNPMPMVDFIDAFVVGEGEEVMIEICQCVVDLKEKKASRQEILVALALLEGVFVPSQYESEQNSLGETFLLHPKQENLPTIINKRLVQDFESSFYPTKPVYPNTNIIHHRLALEVMRGCPGGCRFCQAGYTDRPVRERSPERVKQLAEEGLKNTGYGEMGLLSLSTADYTQLPSLCSGLIQQNYEQRISLSLPSLRIDSFPSRVAQEIGKVKSTGMTFAPEAGTERLRWAVNKLIHDDDIYSKVREAVTSGQTTIKFYFMVGLPTETDEDLQGIVDMVCRIKEILKEENKKRARINVAVSPFVPKPHTAFQWYGQISLEEMFRRVRFIKDQLRHILVKVNYHDPQKSVVEAAMARADSRVGRVIREVYDRGGRFDEWHEHFSFDLWEEAFVNQGLSIHDYAMKNYTQEDTLPWDLISVRIAKSYLWNEWEKSHKTKETKHCGNSKCRTCSVCDGEEIVTVHAPQDELKADANYSMEHDLREKIKPPAQVAESPETLYRYRLGYKKTGRMIYLSHQDVMMFVESVMRRAGLSLAYSKGFNPHPKITFASALSVGVEGLSEFVDILTVAPLDYATLYKKLQSFSSDDFEFTASIEVPVDDKKITGCVHAYQYQVIANHEEKPSTPLESISELVDFETKNLKLRDLRILSLSDHQIEINFVTTVDGGRFIKPLLVVEQIAKQTDCSIVIDKITRLGIFSLGKEHGLIPLIHS